MKKYSVLIIVSLIALSNEGYCQISADSVVKVDNYSKYLGQSCNLREDLINAVKSNDTPTIKKLRNIVIVFHYSDEQNSKNKLLTERENQMLQFYFGEYDELLSGIKTEDDYFLSSKKIQKGYGYPNFECGNLTLDVLGYWSEKSETILDSIYKSDLSTPEKELLSLYWKAILDYIEGEKTLSDNINQNAKGYLDKNPGTEYKMFLERLAVIKRIYQPNAMTLGFGLGISYPTGIAKEYLQGNFTFDFEVGYTIKSWHFRLGYKTHNFNYRDTITLDRIDNLEINQSSSIEYHGATLRVGYTVVDKGQFKIQPFISGELNNFVNYIDIPDSTGIRQKGKTHPMLGFGAEGSLRLIKNLTDMGSGYLYYPREEKDLGYSSLFLNFKIGYYPNVFDRPTNVSGNIFYWTVGLEWMIGKNQVNYRYK